MANDGVERSDVGGRSLHLCGRDVCDNQADRGCLCEGASWRTIQLLIGGMLYFCSKDKTKHQDHSQQAHTLSVYYITHLLSSRLPSLDGKPFTLCSMTEVGPACLILTRPYVDPEIRGHFSVLMSLRISFADKYLVLAT